jgi:g-D-glutamyl-meso-diaminopimelate peptidase
LTGRVYTLSFIFSYNRVFSWAEVAAAADLLGERYKDLLSVSTLGRSVLNRDIKLITFGRGHRRVLFVGTHHGMEHITANLLLMLTERLCAAVERGTRLGRAAAEYIFATRTVDIIPMLNPDGAALAQSGIFWQANARGVDLNHNYNAGFAEYKRMEKEAGITCGCATRYSGEYPESEPETEALCSYIRATEPDVVICLHTQGGEIYFGYEDIMPRGTACLAGRMARRCGYVLSEPTGMASHGGCKDWFTLEFDKPGITIECGRGTNPLPPELTTAIYREVEAALLEALL